MMKDQRGQCRLLGGKEAQMVWMWCHPCTPTPPLFVYWKFGPCVSYRIKATLGSIFLGKELRQEHDVEAERDGTVLSVLLVLVLDSSPQASVAYV